MRVLFVTNMWPDRERPWYGSFVQSQGRSLSAAGIDLDVLAIRGYVSNWEYLRGCRTMLRHNFDARFDLAHAHYGHSAVVARFDLRCPLVISYCGDDLLGTPSERDPATMTRRSSALATAFAQLARIASATITKSEQMAMKLPAAARARNHVIPNGVDLEMFRRGDQSEAREALGWDHDEKVVLFANNPAIGRKNYALAERACALAARRLPELRLRVASGLPAGQMPLWMSAADALVLPSWSEGSPNVVKEALACELPVVATPVGDVPERLRGIPGCHVLAPEVGPFADALLDAIEHSPCPQARAAVTELSSERVAQRVVDVYEIVLGARPGC